MGSRLDAAQFCETYLAHVIDGEPMREIARREGITASTVMRRIHRVEDARDCPAFEARIAAMETARISARG